MVEIYSLVQLVQLLLIWWNVLPMNYSQNKKSWMENTRKPMNEQLKSKVNYIDLCRSLHCNCSTTLDAIKVYFFQNDDIQVDGFWDYQGKVIRGNQRRGLAYRYRLLWVFLILTIVIQSSFDFLLRSELNAWTTLKISLLRWSQYDGLNRWWYRKVFVVRFGFLFRTNSIIEIFSPILSDLVFEIVSLLSFSVELHLKSCDNLLWKYFLFSLMMFSLCSFYFNIVYTFVFPTCMSK